MFSRAISAAVDRGVQLAAGNAHARFPVLRQNLAVADELALEQARHNAGGAHVGRQIRLAEMQLDRLVAVLEDFRQLAQHLAGHHGRKLWQLFLAGVLAQRQLEAVERDEIQVAALGFKQTAGEDDARLVRRDSEGGALHHIAEGVLRDFDDGRIFNLRQRREFFRIHSGQRHARAGAANRRHVPVVDRKIHHAVRQLADDFEKQLAGQHNAAFILNLRVNMRFNAQRQIGTGKPHALGTGNQKNAFVNGRRSARRERAGNDAKRRGHFARGALETHGDLLIG